LKKTVSYAKGETSEPLINLTIGDMFDKIAHTFSNHDALIVRHQKLKYSYKQLQKEVNICAKAFLALGVKKGDRVGIWSQNNAEWVITQLATAKIGAILVNVNPSYRIYELRYTLNHAQCNTLILNKASKYTKMVDELLPELKYLKNIILLGKKERENMTTWQNFIKLSENISDVALELRQKELDCHDAINIQYTSGTTGFPKGATLSHHNILNNGYFVGKIMEFSPNDRLIIPVPLYHCFGMVLGVLTCISHGATMLFPSPNFNADASLSMVEEQKATAMHGVPTMFIDMLIALEKHDYDLSSLRTGVIAGALCPHELMKQINSKLNMKEVEIACGMTEVSPINTQTHIDSPFEKRIGSVGLVHPHVEIKIIDKDTAEILPINSTGEICTRGYSVMLGYWEDKEKTDKAIDKDGWIHSGDLATMDEDGYVNIVGRIKDMIIRGGENIYPKEVEEFFYTHPKIRDFYVVGIPDEKFGEILVAWVKTKDSEELSYQELQSYAKGKIANYKIPTHFKFVDSFPMTVTGKVQKFIMREKSIEEFGTTTKSP
jgi:fatty-acyl-CoA synthase